VPFVTGIGIPYLDLSKVRFSDATGSPSISEGSSAPSTSAPALNARSSSV
jgi:hypothetical protein